MTGSRRSRISSSPWRLVAASGLCALAVVAPGAHAVAAPADGNATFSVSPANPDPADPLTRAYFRPVVMPGASVDEAVTVADTGDTPVDLLVYPVDGVTGTTSGTVYANRADPRVRAGVWLTSSVSSVSIAPHQRRLVGFRVAVPSTAGPGDHVAGIAFEDAHPTRAAGQSVTEVIREVIGVQLRVPGPGQFHLHIDRAMFAVPPATPAVAVIVRLGNDGNRLGQAHLAIDLRGPDGYRYTLNRQLDTILPDDTIDYPVVWPQRLASGFYTVAVTEGGPGGATFTTATSLGATTGARAVAPTASRAGSGHGVLPSSPHGGRGGFPVLALTIGCALLLLLGLAPSARRDLRRRRAAGGSEGARAAPPPTTEVPVG